jgi:hypothetical protein
MIEVLLEHTICCHLPRQLKQRLPILGWEFRTTHLWRPSFLP